MGQLYGGGFFGMKWEQRRRVDGRVKPVTVVVAVTKRTSRRRRRRVRDNVGRL